jgi:hypothetical protein
MPALTYPTCSYFLPMVSSNSSMEMQYCISECFRWINIDTRQCHINTSATNSHWEANISLPDGFIMLPGNLQMERQHCISACLRWVNINIRQHYMNSTLTYSHQQARISSSNTFVFCSDAIQ